MTETTYMQAVDDHTALCL